MTNAPAAKPNYKDTIFLPQTDFPMKAGLAQAEPRWLALWQELDLYNRLQKERADAPTFVLHDGPPYANGDIHIGHALNKILKDTTIRAQSMLGKRAPFVPGADCHGLPIEWKIEEQYRKGNKNKDDVPVLDFRGECRAFAQHWIDAQTAAFKRLGIMGEWDNMYTTMSFEAEAAILAEIHKFVRNGSVYRGSKPVMWSTVEQTSLAEAEVEYHEHNSPTAMVAFPIMEAPNAPELVGAKIVIWTTTPWTLPANRAIAYGEDIGYVEVIPQQVTETSTARIGERYIVAHHLLESFEQAAGIVVGEGRPGFEKPGVIAKGKLQGIITAHPLRDQSYDHGVPLLPGDFVTTDAGTGFVHIAPSHGMDDYLLGLKHGLEVPELVQGDGRYAEQVPLFAGLHVYWPDGKTGPANKAVLDAIAATGNLIASSRITHSYPHSWRSKAPVIFRATPQWFIAMDKPINNGATLRQTALKAIADTDWYPAAGENRIRAMVEGRPDWNISRQRVWGVPLGFFVNKATNELLRDEAVFGRIHAAFLEEGGDAWFRRDPQEFLGDDYKAEDFEQIMDTGDVWLDSGSTHAFVLEARPNLHWPADLYLEGSDQHRAWFQTSLLIACGTRGRAPYKAVVTHGFTNDEHGHKMSKSVGNVVAPAAIIKDYGADILRLWALSSNYADDNKIGPDIIKQTAELYRRLRNTLRYLLGALAGWDEAERVAPADMPELERYMLHQLAALDGKLRAAIAVYDYTAMTALLHAFCNAELSSFYFDIRKDSLYCDGATDPRRRACRTVMAILYDYLTAWLAPVLCFTAEEAWQHGRALGLGASDAVPSVHLRMFPDAQNLQERDNVQLGEKWFLVRAMRAQVTAELEKARANKLIGSALEAAPQLTIPDYTDLDWAELCITSDMQVQQGKLKVEVEKAPGVKCERCWRVLPEVAANANQLCLRCDHVVAR